MPKLPLRIKSLLAVPLVIAFWQFSTVALANTAIISPEGSAYSSATANSSIDGSDCTPFANEKKQPSQDNDNSPDSSSDMDAIDGGSDDLNANYSSRNDQDTPHFPVIDRVAVSFRAPNIIRTFLPLPVRCIPCLQEHVRERAPLILV